MLASRYIFFTWRGLIKKPLRAQERVTVNDKTDAAGDVTVITVTYNSGNVINAALQSVIGHPRVAECFVVDNASGDDTCAIVRDNHPSVRLVKNSENSGYGIGNNLALEKCTTKYALLLNPDAELEKNTLDKLLSVAESDPDAAIIAPALRGESGEQHRSHRQALFEREKRLSRRKKINCETQEVDFVIAAVWLVKVEVLRKLGFFDPNLFLFYEDDDLCLRVRNAGGKVLYTQSTHAKHIWGGSSAGTSDISSFKEFHMAVSRCYIEYKYQGKDAASRLVARLRAKYSFKVKLHRLFGKAAKVARYQARLKGLKKFSQDLSEGRYEG